MAVKRKSRPHGPAIVEHTMEIGIFTVRYGFDGKVPFFISEGSGLTDPGKDAPDFVPYNIRREGFPQAAMILKNLYRIKMTKSS